MSPYTVDIPEGPQPPPLPSNASINLPAVQEQDFQEEPPYYVRGQATNTTTQFSDIF